VYAGDKNRNIKIEKSITIIGKSKQNTIINGESCGSLFNVTSTGRLTLIDVTLLNGYSTRNGGSIYCDGGEINIKNCILKNSKAAENGGVIYNNLGALNIENSCFTNNSAYQYGGVLYTLGITSIKNSDFTENVLISDSGVGACIAAGGKINLDGCLFYNCFSPYSAAALLNIGNATINNCRFEKLSTNYTAGAISNHKYMVINNSYFGYNDVQYYAGAILDYAGEETGTPGGPHVITEVYNTIFEKNHAGYHGAVSNNFRNTYLHMENCALVDNYIVLNEKYGDIALDDNATLQYCWWGQNGINPYYYSRHDGGNNPEKINASRWLLMTFTAKDNVIYRDEINRLTVSLKQYFDNETKEIHEYEGEFNLPLEVTFFTDVGELGTKILVNGAVTFDFNPQGASVIYAKINNQILKIADFQLRKTKIIVDDFEKYYGSSSKLAIKLAKENNIPISNKQLTVSVGGNVYTIKTDKNGIAKLTLKNNPKTYSVKITFNGDNYIGSSKSVKVKIVKPIIKASKLKIHKKRKFTVIFKDANKKPIKKVKVKFKIKGKTYIRTTNSKGKANIKINLKAGKKYKVKVGFKDTKYYGTTTLTKKIKVIK
jgi:predicted outer membrane repeat protein